MSELHDLGFCGGCCGASPSSLFSHLLNKVLAASGSQLGPSLEGNCFNQDPFSPLLSLRNAHPVIGLGYKGGTCKGPFPIKSSVWG